MPSRLLSRIQKIPQADSDALISSQISADFPQCAIAQFIGVVNNENIEAVAQSFNTLITENIQYLVIDFSAIEDISPSGMGLMLALRQKLRDRNGDMVLCGMRPRMERLQRVLGLEGFFSVALDSTQAVRSLRAVLEDTFPLSIKCPACDTMINIERPGRGRCQNCKAVITAFPEGTVTLG